MSLVIREHARARLITDGPDPRRIPVELRCDPGDPRTVRIGLPGGVDWAFGRDLLEKGLRSPVTRGDIRVWPCGRAQLILELHSADGVAVLQFDRAPLIRFLRRVHDQFGSSAGTGGGKGTGRASSGAGTGGRVRTRTDAVSETPAGAPAPAASTTRT
ncbi:SsgA family sporulation/cell division regulator [Streptomyces clavifer]|uniref:SsgA family sporulation/cell division regulator n=1 Tax=Streptomyces clavifer TaxID=68188 RepID=UPI0033ADB5ED